MPLTGADAPTATFTAPLLAGGVSGTAVLTFQLTVSDGALSGTDTVTVTVEQVNHPPVANAGANQTVQEASTVRLDGSASQDPDGDALVSQPRLWPPNHKLLPARIVGVSDADNDQVTITMTGVTQDEPVNGLGDGDTSPDAVLQGATVLLRAERAGGGNGRVYQVAFTASDNQLTGGRCTGTVKVEVPPSMKPSIVVIDDGQGYTSTQP